MKEVRLQIDFQEYDSPGGLPPDDAELLTRAHEALDKAYAPYSRFFVGAAARLENGEIVMGSNQENASFPLSLCAERVALSAVESFFPNARVRAMAIAVKNHKRVIDRPAAPCGACRQVIAEKEWRQKSPMRIIFQGETGPVYVISSGSDLLPFVFDPNYL
jgi:cytidine deaminase